MDPDKVLEDLRSSVEQVNAIEEAVEDQEEGYTDEQSGRLQQLAVEACGSFEVLDEWLKKGGFFPKSWRVESLSPELGSITLRAEMTPHGEIPLEKPQELKVLGYSFTNTNYYLDRVRRDFIEIKACRDKNGWYEPKKVEALMQAISFIDHALSNPGKGYLPEEWRRPPPDDTPLVAAVREFFEQVNTGGIYALGEAFGKLRKALEKHDERSL